MDLNEQLRNMSAKSPWAWSVSNVVLPMGTLWDFKERRWQIPLFEDHYPLIVSKKSAQVGETTIFICKALWFMDHYKANVIWTFPRQDDVTDFVQTRFTPIMNNSPYLMDAKGTARDDPQSQRIMRFRDGYIYFLEASVEPRGTPGDLLANDEVDRSNPDFLDAFVGRLGNSKWKYHYRFSTPTIPNYGIDAIFNNESDARYWMVKCPHCNHFQSMKWNANFMLDADEKPYYGCEKCRGVLPAENIINGEFVAMYPSRNVHGYHITGMMMPISKPPAFMYARYLTVKRKNFYNLFLGETYETGGITFDAKTIINSVYPEGEESYTHKKDSAGGTYMGVDQKGDLHVVIAQPIVSEDTKQPVMRLIHAEVIERRIGTDSWRRLAKLMEWYNVRFCVHDALPNEHNAQEFREAFKGRVGLKFDSVEKAKLFTFDESSGKILLSRTQSFDGFLDDIKSGLWRFWGSKAHIDNVLSTIIAHCGNLKRDEEERRNRSGGVDLVGVWRKTGPDDFAHAWAYCRLAYLVKPSTRLQVTLIGSVTDQEEDGYRTVYKDSIVWPGRKIPKRIKITPGLG